MPELYIGIKLTDSPTPTLRSNQCQICMRQLLYAKVLACGHLSCLSCLENLEQETERSDFVVICPIDKVPTTIKNGDSKYLQTRFFAKLLCESCNKRKDFQKSWWCETCGSTSCSNCAMRVHRNHTCDQWDTFKVATECYNYFRLKNSSIIYSQNFDEIRTEIRKFCNELQSKLLQEVDNQERLMTAQKTIEDTFGSLAHLRESTSPNQVEHIDKKISLISNLMPRLFSMEHGSLNLPTKSSHSPILLPSVDDTFEFCTSAKNSKQKLASARNEFLFGISQKPVGETRKLF